MGLLPHILELLRRSLLGQTMMTYDFPQPTKRVRFSDKVRAELFLRDGGVCGICGFKIWPGEGFEVEHTDPLWSGGSADPRDCKVVHPKCHRGKTSREATQRAKEARVRNKHIGAVRAKGTLPGGKKSRLKKRMDGRVEIRETGEIL